MHTRLPTAEGPPSLLLLAALSALWHETQHESADLPRPPAAVCRMAWYYLGGVAPLLDTGQCYGALAPDSEGGIRIEWQAGATALRLVLPAAPGQRPYLYYESGTGYGLEHAVSRARVAQWVRWLLASAERHGLEQTPTPPLLAAPSAG